MTTRTQRLKKLVKVQEQLKALHETRHASFLAAATRAEAEARDLAERSDSEGSLASLFPELYTRKISEALNRQQAELASARAEAGRVATATARTKMVERAWREVRRSDERDRAELERLELVQRKSMKNPT
ncbi:hypothetical protein GA830_00615 [Mesorhizobium sp. NBSH29]|uniref:hypothetical protein n=1 Tax=Mesorhizobium sp. NBSH29 TaxID=2654249 RepID=UPI0018966CEF|nr:hypothetical protein [Mesorhizobium sp. NBSH29]QPC85412.1 hypothetical protein GA830_00615 [Mesorhizobium sp. NBSH29]